MRFEKDPDLVRWLEFLTITKSSFQWDRGNSTKNLKHNVTQEEIEELFHGTLTIGGRILEPYHPENRWILLSKTKKGKKLSLIFTIRDGLIRPISCRPMRTKEEKHYEEESERFTDQRI